MRGGGAQRTGDETPAGRRRNEHSFGSRLFRCIYSSLYVAAAPVIGLIVGGRRDLRKRVGQLFGTPSKEALEYAAAVRGTCRIGLAHAVSAGEMLTILPVLRGVSERVGYLRWVVSTTTEEAFRVMNSSDGPPGGLTFSPLDFPFFVRRYLNALDPCALLISETDLWPAMLLECADRGIGVFLVNGRISEGIWKWGKRARNLMPSIMERICSAFECCLVQSEADRERLVDMGIPPRRIVVTGNLKYESSKPGPPSERARMLRDTIMRLAGGRRIVVGGSTHEPEEMLLAETVDRNRHLLVVAPRNIERAPAIEAAMEKRGLGVFRTAGGEGTEAAERPDVVLVDELGVLRHLYPTADVVFIGGTVAPKGCHNFMEAAWHAKPVVVGPDVTNFREDVERFAAEGAIVRCGGGPDTASAVLRLLEDEDEARRIGRNARRVLEESNGALERTCRTISEKLGLR